MDKKKNIFWLILTIVCAIVCAIFFTLFGYFIPQFSKVISEWGNQEVMVAIAIAAAIISFSTPFIENYFNRKRDKEKRKWQEEQKTSVYLIDLGIKLLENNFVLFSASIQNVGDKKIETKIANLYIDQGEQQVLANENKGSKNVAVDYYEFPFILEHKEEIKGRPDCVLCKKCFRANDPNYPEEVVSQSLKGKSDMFRAHYELKHLSQNSIKYINPNEKFSEDVIVQFKKHGVYRATLFVGAEGEADCCCATKQFYIPNDFTDPKS